MLEKQNFGSSVIFNIKPSTSLFNSIHSRVGKPLFGLQPHALLAATNWLLPSLGDWMRNHRWNSLGAEGTMIETKGREAERKKEGEKKKMKPERPRQRLIWFADKSRFCWIFLPRPLGCSPEPRQTAANWGGLEIPQLRSIAASLGYYLTKPIMP